MDDTTTLSNEQIKDLIQGANDIHDAFNKIGRGHVDDHIDCPIGAIASMLERSKRMGECCKNCRYDGKLIMWERNDEGRYLPNYDKPLECCIALADEGQVFGHTEPTDESDMCEMFAPKLKEQENED